METKEYIQGENNKELFGELGKWLTSKNVHDKLGMAITSEDNDIWRIIYLNGVKIGFSLERKMKSTNAIHLRFVYADPERKKALIKKSIKHAQKEKCSSIWSNDRKSEALWKELGFDFTPRARGEFGRWEKSLEIKKDKV